MTDDYELIPFNGKLVAKTAKAWLVNIMGVEEWLPMSQCTLDDPDIIRGEPCSGTIPLWLVRKKDLREACTDSLNESRDRESGADVPTYPHVDPDLDDDLPF